MKNEIIQTIRIRITKMEFNLYLNYESEIKELMLRSFSLGI